MEPSINLQVFLYLLSHIAREILGIYNHRYNLDNDQLEWTQVWPGAGSWTPCCVVLGAPLLIVGS